jgi:hypothetical protein
MAFRLSYILKVVDAKPSEVRKALEQAGITVRSLAEIHKEEIAVAGK